MADDRTEEQRAADDTLRAAIEQYEAAYRPDDTGMSAAVLTDYIVVSAHRGFLHDGDDGSRIVIATPNSGDSPAYILVGLLDMARAEITEGFLYGDRFEG